MRTFYLAHCHGCGGDPFDPANIHAILPVPFDSRERRDEWVAEHRHAHRYPITTWTERFL